MELRPVALVVRLLGGDLGLLALATIWSTMTCPQRPAALSTIWIWAVLPISSHTFQVCQVSVSSFMPVAVRTVLPPTSRLMHALPGWLPPPIRKLIYGRVIFSGGEVSVPVDLSPPRQELTKPLPSKPATCRCCGELAVGRPGAECLAGGAPLAVGFALEVGDDDVRLLGRRRGGGGDEMRMVSRVRMERLRGRS